MLIFWLQILSSYLNVKTPTINKYYNVEILTSHTLNCHNYINMQFIIFFLIPEVELLNTRSLLHLLKCIHITLVYTEY